MTDKSRARMEAKLKESFTKNEKDYWDALIQFGCDYELMPSWFHAVGYQDAYQAGLTDPDANAELLDECEKVLTVLSIELKLIGRSYLELENLLTKLKGCG